MRSLDPRSPLAPSALGLSLALLAGLAAPAFSQDGGAFRRALARSSPPAPAAARSDSGRLDKRLGTERLNARLVTSASASAGGAASVNHSLRLSAFGRSASALSLTDRLQARFLGTGPRLERRYFKVEVGGLELTAPYLRKTLPIIPRTPIGAIPLGPFMIVPELEVALSVELRRIHVVRRRSFESGVEGSVTLGGTLGTGLGIPGARVGVEAALDLVRASIPALVRFDAQGMHYSVYQDLESRLTARLFARAGFGVFGKTWSAELPFLRFRFAQQRFRLIEGRLLNFE